MTNQDLHLEFFLKIQHVYGQKMIDSPSYDKPGSQKMDLNRNFFKDSNMCMVEKDDGGSPPWSLWQTRHLIMCTKENFF